MSSTTRRNFLMATGGSVAAVSMGTDFLNAVQLSGHSPSETAGWQHGNFSNVWVPHIPATLFCHGCSGGVATHFRRARIRAMSPLRERLAHPAAQYGSSQQEAAQKAAGCSVQKRYSFTTLMEKFQSISGKFAVCDLIRQYKL